MFEETKSNINNLKRKIETRRKIFGKTMIAFCFIGVLMAIAAFVLLIVGVAEDNKVCGIIGIILNFLDILTLCFSLIKAMKRFNDGLKNLNAKE